MARSFKAAIAALAVVRGLSALDAWGAEVSPGWAETVRGLVRRLEGRVEACAASGSCPVEPGRAWMEIRWTGATRLVRSLDRRSSEPVMLARLAAAELPRPIQAGESRIWVLGRNQGWEKPRVLFERTTASDRSIALVTELGQEFSKQPVPSNRRFWIFTSQGEVIHQSEGLFLGSTFSGNAYLGRSGEQLSFDQLRVRASWSSDPRLGGWLLEEELLPEAVLSSGSRSGLGGLVFKVLMALGLLGLLWSCSSLLRVLYRWARLGRKLPRPSSPLAAASGKSASGPAEAALEVSVPRVIEGRPVTAPSEKATLDSILSARNLQDLANRVMTLVSQHSESPVLYLEFHRETGLAVFRGQLGLPDASAPLSLRVPLADVPGQVGEQPALQKLLLQRTGVSYFEVLELRSPNRDGLRSRLLGIFVILRPGVSSFEHHELFERLMDRAGRYYDAILRPHPPGIPGRGTANHAQR
jgi:hypothetical protein